MGDAINGRRFDSALGSKGILMPLVYDDVPGSWGPQSEGWPETSYSIGKFLLCSKADVVPYGSYVVVGTKHISGGKYDYSEAVIRIETEALKQKLEAAHHGMFIQCRSHIIEELGLVLDKLSRPA
jgi:hypothetical protein